MSLDEEAKVMRSYFTGENIRIIGSPGSPLFCGIDVARRIDDSRYKITLAGYTPEYVRKEKIADSRGCIRETYFLTETGLYKYLLQSHRPAAEKFQLFVYEQLRKLRERLVEDALIENAVLRTEADCARAIASRARREAAMEKEVCERSVQVANDLREKLNATTAELSMLRRSRKPPLIGENSYAERDAFLRSRYITDDY